MGFSRQEYWSGLWCPSPGCLPDPWIEPVSPALTGRFFTTSATWLDIPWNKPQCPDAGEWGDPGWKTYSSERGSFSGHDPGKWQKVQQKREILSRNLSWHVGGGLSEFSRSLILRHLVWVYVGIRARIVCGSRWGWGPDSNQILKVQIGIRTF